jgi:hypothetical protein
LLAHSHPGRLRDLLNTVYQLTAHGVLPMPESTHYPLADAATAIRVMSGAQHTGKLVLDVPHTGRSRVIHPTPQTVYVSKARPAASLSRRLIDRLTYGVAAGDVGGKLATVVGSAAAQLPAAWLLARSRSHC